MVRNFKFAVISDPHIALPHTIWDHPSRFHLVEVSIPALEQILAQLSALDLDFLLMPGDLTQHGEPENHAWLVQRLKQLPFPVYVVPGNHDIPQREKCDRSIGLAEFPQYYTDFGYSDPNQPYYIQSPLPGLHVIGLNSNFYKADGQQLDMGRLDEAQFNWLRDMLPTVQDDMVIVMVHHNVVEHLPNQLQHPLGRRYMLQNQAELLALLTEFDVPLIFTGHLHVQDIAPHRHLYEITTGSLVSYPHPYRVLNYRTLADGRGMLTVETQHVQSVPGWPQLPETSREWMGDRSLPFMLRLLTHPPLCLPEPEAKSLADDLRYFWADVAEGDALFDFSHFPAQAQRYFEAFSATTATGELCLIDNAVTLKL